MDEKHIPAGITGFFTAEEARAYHLIPVERNAGELKCYRNFGIPLLVPYTKDFGRITQF